MESSSIRGACRLAGLLGLVTIAGSVPLTATPITWGFEGHEVRMSLMYPDTSTVSSQMGTAFAGSPGLEFFTPFLFGIDISDTAILIQSFSTGNFLFSTVDFVGFRLQDEDGGIPAIIGATPQPNSAGFDASRVFFDENTLYMNFSGLEVPSMSIITIDVQFASSQAQVETPEPGSFFTVAAALLIAAGFGSRRLRRKRGRSLLSQT